MKKVYIVTIGEYSDYKILAVFSTKEQAEEYIKLFIEREFWSDRGMIEEYLIDQWEDFANIKKDKTGYYVIMTKEGKTVDIFQPHVYDNIEDFKDHINKKYYFQEMGSYKGSLHISVLAKSEQHAIKIANEKRVQLIANNLWGKENR